MPIPGGLVPPPGFIAFHLYRNFSLFSFGDVKMLSKPIGSHSPVPREISFRADFFWWIVSGSAMELPQQVRSQAPAEGGKLGKEKELPCKIPSILIRITERQ
jgi:hypothetical protein